MYLELEEGKLAKLLLIQMKLLSEFLILNQLQKLKHLIKEKISWILRKQKEILENEKKIEISKPDYAEESTLPYLGKNHKIEIKIFGFAKKESVEGEKNSIVYKNGRFLFSILS